MAPTARAVNPVDLATASAFAQALNPTAVASTLVTSFTPPSSVALPPAAASAPDLLGSATTPSFVGPTTALLPTNNTLADLPPPTASGLAGALAAEPPLAPARPSAPPSAVEPQPAPVPEPAPLALFAMASLFAMRRLRRAARANSTRP